MKRPELIDFSQERIRVLHYTWIAFFITFFVWFNMAPVATTMLRSVDWLTREHVRVLAICNVALTIPARILIGALIDRFGPRIVFSGLMITMSIPVFFFAFGNSFVQLLISRLVLGSIGAGFVVGIKMVANWFPPKMIGRAEGFGIPSKKLDGTDFFEVQDAARDAIERARCGEGPSYLHIKAPMYFGHYEGDAETYRAPGEVEKLRAEQDCLAIFSSRVVSEGRLKPEDLSEIDLEVRALVDEAIAAAKAASPPDAESLYANVYQSYEAGS